MTARVFLCVIFAGLAARAAPLLSIDFNHRTNNPSVATQPGFSSFIITSNVSDTSPQISATMRMIGTNRVSIWGNGPDRRYHDRTHALPTNRANFTQSLLLRDGVYSPDTTTNGGLNILIENLPATNRLQLTIWSFDARSEPVRTSDWYANGVLARAAYQFTNWALPVSDEECRFSFTAVVDGAGRLQIEGRRNGMSTNHVGAVHPAVFLNALRIDPEPLEIVGIETSGNELRLTFVVRPQPGDYLVEETSGGPWRAATGVVYGPAVNNRVTARFGTPGGTRLYRVRYAY